MRDRNNISFPKIHDLPSNIYSASRYPSNIGLLPNHQIPTMAEAKEIFDFAKKIEGIFKMELGIEKTALPLPLLAQTWRLIFV
jgi:hypothetical protein